jgi:hypothetical protein
MGLERQVLQPVSPNEGPDEGPDEGPEAIWNAILKTQS